jgi:membrane-associated phospholipid phosphatase
MRRIAGAFYFAAHRPQKKEGGRPAAALPLALSRRELADMIGTTIFLVAWRHQRRLAYLLAPIITGVVMATVYGRFHYALDSIAGLLVAAVVVCACRRSVDPAKGSAERSG